VVREWTAASSWRGSHGGLTSRLHVDAGGKPACSRTPLRKDVGARRSMREGQEFESPYLNRERTQLIALAMRVGLS